MSTKMTLVFLIDDTKHLVLLGAKKTGFGLGKILGIGGKVQAGEITEVAACREVLEEVNVTIQPEHLISGGKVEFIFPEKTGWHHEVFLYTCKVWQGHPSESAEIMPEWFPLGAIPFERMWDDAKYWLPQLLRGEKIDAKITYGEDLKTVSFVKWL